MLKQKNIYKYYYYIIVAILTCLSLINTYSNSHGLNLKILSNILGIIFLILGILNFFINGIKIRKIFFLFLVFTIFCMTKFNNFLILPIFISISFLNYSPQQLIRGYYLSNLWCLVITGIMAMIGLAPMRSWDGILSLGFSNENTLGLFTLLISLFYLLEIIIKGKAVKHYYCKFFAISIFLLLNLFITMDRTVIVIFILFYILTMFFRIKNVFFKYLLISIECISPILLTYVSILCFTNYRNNNFYFNLNKLLSNRIYMWNWFYNKIPLSLYPSNLKINQFKFWGTVDGSYTYLLFQSGIVTTCIICLLLVYCNFLLLKNRLNYIFSLLVSLEIGAFSENILQLPAIVFIVPFAILALLPNWINKEWE